MKQMSLLCVDSQTWLLRTSRRPFCVMDLSKILRKPGLFSLTIQMIDFSELMVSISAITVLMFLFFKNKRKLQRDPYLYYSHFSGFSKDRFLHQPWIKGWPWNGCGFL